MSLSKFLSPTNDVAFRKIFGSEEHRNIVIHFINDVLELQGDNQIVDLEFLPPNQQPDIAAKKESIVDVLCRAHNGVQIIVEMQAAPQDGFAKRAQYYAAKAYAGQLNKGQEEDEEYHNLKEIIFIAISKSTLFRGNKGYKSDHIILNKNSHTHDLKDFSFTFIELSKFKKKKISDLNTILEKWCYFFKYAAITTEDEVKQVSGNDLVIEQAYTALNKFNWTEHELLAYEAEVKRRRDLKATLRHQYKQGHAEGKAEGIAEGKAEGKAEGIAEGKAEGIAEGIARGKAEGKAEGIAEGKAEGIAEGALNLLRQNHPIELIAVATGLSHKQITKLQNQL